MERSPADVPAGVSPRFWRLLTAEPLAAQTALDVGTGSGRLALALAPRCRAVVGIDRELALVEEARRRAAAGGLSNARFFVADAEAVDFARVHPDVEAPPGLVVAHLCMSTLIAVAAGKALAPGRVFAAVAFHADQWRETGRRSRFAYDEDQMHGLLTDQGLIVEHLEVEREVTEFESLERALAAAVGLEEKWKADGRWFRYLRFLEEGGRTLTRSHLIVKARRR